MIKKRNKIITLSNRTEKTHQVPVETKEKRMKYSMSDVCVCCGQYMSEGTGMVCEKCLNLLQ